MSITEGGGTGRRETLLDAAISVLGTVGSRGLTHRAVDAAAQVPTGSTSNHFRTRQALIEAVVGRLATLDRAAWEAAAAGTGPAGGLDGLVSALSRYLLYATGPARDRTAARLVLFVEASGQPSLREPLERSRAAVRGWGTEVLVRFGSPEPARHCEMVLDYLEGVIMHQLVFPDPLFDPSPALRDLLAALLPLPPIKEKDTRSEID